MSYSALVWTEGKYRLNLPYALVYNASLTYATDDIVQVTEGTKNRLFRALQSATNRNPLTQSAYWAEDVIDASLQNLTDDDIISGSEILVSWPDASTKLNFCTTRFLNEEKDFSEDTVSWPEKTPQDVTDVVYATYLSEDNNIALEAEIFVEYGLNSSYKEISSTLDVPAKCVDNALTRIRKKASEVYNQFKDDENKDVSHKMPKK